MLTKKELNQIEHNLNMRRDFGGTDKDRMLAHIHEQDKALAEARKILNGVQAKAALAAKMCSVEAYAAGFRVIADFVDDWLDRHGEAE